MFTLKDSIVVMGVNSLPFSTDIGMACLLKLCYNPTKDIILQYYMKYDAIFREKERKKDARLLLRQAWISSCDNWLDPNNVEDINTKRSFM